MPYAILTPQHDNENLTAISLVPSAQKINPNMMASPTYGWFGLIRYFLESQVFFHSSLSLEGA